MTEVTGTPSEELDGEPSTTPTEALTPTVSSEARTPTPASVALPDLNGSDQLSQTPYPPPRRPPPTNSRHEISYTLRGLIPNGTNPEQRTWSLDRSVARSCNVEGHNGLTIGEWWPHPVCALRDGAHGASVEVVAGTVGMMAGTGGSRSGGAYSILVFGTYYASLDRDRGNSLYYSGAAAVSSIDPDNLIIPPSFQALRTSQKEGRAIRVLHGAGGNSPYHPSVGLRYDGLYKIEGERIVKDHNNKERIQFKLRRERDQGPLDLTRPNAHERAIFDQLN